MNQAQIKAVPEQERLPSTEADLQRAIADLMHKVRSQERQSLNASMVQTYWRIGQQVAQFDQCCSEPGGVTRILPELVERLNQSLGSNFSIQCLLEFRQFYLAYPVLPTMRRKLSWNHYRRLLRIQSPQVRAWFAHLAAEQGWSVQTLETQINCREHERTQFMPSILRLPDHQRTQGPEGDLHSFMNDPLVLGFLGITERPSLPAQGLKEALLGSLQQHLLQHERGFAFVTRQKRLHTTGHDVCIDLVFYNYLLKCFVLVDLKVGKLAHQDVDQMDMYVRVFDQLHRQEGDNPTLGLILCSERNAAVAKYSLLADKPQLFASKYQALMPTEAELQAELERDRALLEMNQR